MVFAQEEEAVLWNPDNRLSWKDFRAIPPITGNIAATTASGISYYFSSTEVDGKMEVDFTVRTYFYPDKSWYKAEICNSVILSHEQLHFDISELFARKMRAEMGKTRFTKNIKAEVKAIYQKINAELADFQNRYDSETDYSRNVAQQKVWNETIKAALGY
ncbi:MAG: DUF922 domain-containing protein [Eudoraea sp.]|nr:DUF922 domain-containing protein [Eudoraea sp.]MBT8223211.1 DUF922 domain-containing protein [Eudoraea sp.]